MDAAALGRRFLDSTRGQIVALLRREDRTEIVFTATSRWCKTDANPDFYLVGFQINELDPSARELIGSLIKDFSYNEDH